MELMGLVTVCPTNLPEGWASVEKRQGNETWAILYQYMLCPINGVDPAVGQLINLSAWLLASPIVELSFSGDASFLEHLENVPAIHEVGCCMVVVDELG